MKNSIEMQKYKVHKIRKKDAHGVELLIKKVMPEFGACGAGFAINDPEVLDMYRCYQRPRAIYFVVSDQTGRVVGGAGIAQLEGAKSNVCELRKMYIYPELRGLGFGQKLMDLCLDAAVNFGYTHCYLETLRSMKQAKALYAKNGFRSLKKPKGKTGHFGCDEWQIKKI